MTTNRPRLEFDLDAFDVDSNTPVARFRQPLTLTVNLTGLIDLQQIPSDMYVALYTISPEGNQVPIWPIQIDAEAGTVHFGTPRPIRKGAASAAVGPESEDLDTAP